MTDRLQGRVAVITGGGSGIGRATSARFAAEGAAVLVSDINGETARETVAIIEADGGRALAMTVDVADKPAVKAMVEEAIGAFGRIDVLFNNAANTSAADAARDGDLLTLDPEIFHKAMDINVLAGVAAAQQALPHMIKQGSGSIIFTSSSISLGTDVRSFSYGSSKATVNWLVKAFAVNFGKKGIRCNGILPGIIETPAMMNWANRFQGLFDALVEVQNAPRFGTPEDVAATALFLASDDSLFVNGALIPVDGAMTATIPFSNVTRRFVG